MKRLLLIVCLFLWTGAGLFAQQDENEGNEKIRDKMNEYIQRRLNLTPAEAEKFSPVFLRYFREWRQTLQESRGEPLLTRQQRIVDLRLRYRDEFKTIIGEKRSAEVFDHQERFIQEVRRLRQERLQDQGLRPRRFRALIE
ncbi:MAG TPA: hypothetical protein VG870_03625 [Chitinophagaceae bacterium]|nr:hypothetical protein [Chitinophagaceae bacterium]